MELKLSTWCEIKAYLNNRTDIIIPIGSTEQHGPMGLIGTDFICPEIIARQMAQKTGVLVAPTLPIGMSHHHLSFPGSMSLRPSTLMALVKDVVQSLTIHGFTHLLFLNGHGGNIASIKAAFAEIYSEYSLEKGPSPLKLKLHSWYEGETVVSDCEKYFKNAEGHHATPSEIALSFYAYPDSVKTAELDPKIAPDGEITDRYNFAKTFKDGRMASDSSLASVEIGKQILKSALKDALKTYQAFIK